MQNPYAPPGASSAYAGRPVQYARIGRLRFVALSFSCVAGAVALAHVTAWLSSLFEPSWMETAAIIVWLLAAPVLLVCLHMLCRRRWHDLGRSGWWNGVFLVPLAGIVAVPVLILAKGAREANVYGPAPPDNGAWLIAYSVCLLLMTVCFWYGAAFMQ